MPQTFAGLRADEDGLTYWGGRLRWRSWHRARLTPDGVVFVPAAAWPTEPLSWDDYLPAPAAFLRRGDAASWSISDRADSRSASHVTIGADPMGRRQPAGVQVVLVDPVLTILIGAGGGGVPFGALCQYLQQTPTARPGLADPARCARLVEALRAGDLRRAPKHENRLYVGRSGDVRHAMDEVVKDRYRLYRGRPVAGEPFPTAGELADLTRQRLPARLTDVATDEALAAMAADWLARAPWPFGVLLPHS